MQLDRTKFKGEEKKLKRHYEEQRMLEKILVHIKQCNSYNELLNNPISKMYGFEPLKHDLVGYYSFNLCKNSGVIRLIISFNEEKNIINLEYISMNHYNDFKKRV